MINYTAIISVCVKTMNCPGGAKEHAGMAPNYKQDQVAFAEYLI